MYIHLYTKSELRNIVYIHTQSLIYVHTMSYVLGTIHHTMLTQFPLRSRVIG